MPPRPPRVPRSTISPAVSTLATPPAVVPPTARREGRAGGAAESLEIVPPGFDPPPFRPHRLLRGGHAQTLAGVFWAGREESPGGPAPATAAVRHAVDLGDGDAAALHDDRPPAWAPGDPAALLVHGLGGCRNSPYMVRIARKLVGRGVRAFRLDHRTCGDGSALSRRTYHAGLSADVRAALRFINALCPASPLGLAGFSMGGNMVLKALGEHAGGDPAAALPGVPVRAVAVNPAADLAACCESLTGPMQRFYDWRFARYLVDHVANSPAVCREQVRRLLEAKPRRIREFDAALTVPGWRFESVEHYYAAESAAPLVARIGSETPTLILTAADDPLVPAGVVEGLTVGPGVTRHVAAGGGHLGFIARGGPSNPDPDRRWMDWRVVDWLTAPPAPAAAPPPRRPARPR